MTKFLNISTDVTLGGSSASDSTVASQKAIKSYVDSQTGTAPTWGNITGTLSNQTDLQSALNDKVTGNASITGATKCKITYDSKGLVTGGADLTASDIPDLSATYQATLTAGSGIDITSNTISAKVDGATVDANFSDQLEALGVINPRSDSAMRIWQGTETQWNEGEATTWYNWVNASASSSAKTLPSTGNWRNAIYDGTRMIVVSNNSSTFLYSTDGTNWSSGNIKISDPFQLVVGNGVWLAIPSSGQTASRSTDGTSWSTITTPRGSTGIVYGNDKFVSTANGYFMYSADGLSWTDLGFIAGATYIAYGNGLYVTTGGSKSLYSNDGINWNTGTTSVGSYSNICYGANKFVALPFSDGNSIAYTADGDTWTIVENAMPYTQSWGAITYGNGIFVATGYNTANAAYSYDGITWHGFSMPSSAKWFGAIYNGSDFYAFGYQTNKAAKMTIGTWECFTTDENPTTSSDVYDAVSTPSTLTITGVGTGTITLSDDKTYSYNSGGNEFTYRSVGEMHPDWLCNINGVGVKLGNTVIATKTPELAAVATSGSYNDLINKPYIGSGILTIQKNGVDVRKFSANAGSDTTANITVPTNTNELTNGAGFITGINSSDVTTALGYTPYDSSNPSGYTSNVGTVTSVNNTSPDGSGNVSLTIPTVDQTYSSSSANAQSGSAVAEAISDRANTNLSNLTNTGTANTAFLVMPSSTFENLTLGASGSTYTAPANGYLFLSKAASAVGQYIQFSDGVSYPTMVAGTAATNLCLLYPCRKGVTVTINYSAEGSTNAFRFIYAEGSKWEA